MGRSKPHLILNSDFPGCLLRLNDFTNTCLSNAAGTEQNTHLVMMHVSAQWAAFSEKCQNDCFFSGHSPQKTWVEYPEDDGTYYGFEAIHGRAIGQQKNVWALDKEKKTFLLGHDKQTWNCFVHLYLNWTLVVISQQLGLFSPSALECFELWILCKLVSSELPMYFGNIFFINHATSPLIDVLHQNYSNGPRNAFERFFSHLLWSWPTRMFS